VLFSRRVAKAFSVPFSSFEPGRKGVNRSNAWCKRNQLFAVRFNMHIGGLFGNYRRPEEKV
jgi:hypothetical protein